MRPPLFVSWAALAVLCCGSAIAQSDDEERFPGPDHLVPVNPYPAGVSSKYQQLWNQLLKVSEFEADDPDELFGPGTKIIVMIHRPPFDGEDGVFLKDQSTRDRPEFILIHTRASRSIYFSMPENDWTDEDDDEHGGKKPPQDKPKEEPVHIVQTTRPLDPARAARIFDLWSRMLRGVHYPTGPSGGIEDADCYEFRFRRYERYGQARTPLKGPVRCLVDLGSAMIAVCESPGEDLEKNLARLDGACDALEKQLNAQKASSKKEGVTAAP